MKSALISLSLACVGSMVAAGPISMPRNMLRRQADQSCLDKSFAGDADLAVSIPTGVPIFYLESALKADHEQTNGTETYQDSTYCGTGNDTCLFVVTGQGTKATFKNVNMTKFGYSTDLNQASFFGVNAMCNIQNGSAVEVTSTKLTSHNGAAGWYSYGSGTTINVTSSYFTATGPVSHGLYASGNGSIQAKDFYCETYGYRSSCLSGDNPAGYLYIEDTEVKMWGLGSAVAYTVGASYLNRVKGYTYQSFALIADGPQHIDVKNSDIEGGINFATVVLFGSQPGYKVGTAYFADTVLRSHGQNHAIFGFGNIYGTVYATNITVSSESGMLAVSNATGITQKFDHWRGDSEGAAASPAFASIYLSQTTVAGSIQAINGSTLTFSLGNSSTWKGAATVDSSANVAQIGLIVDASSKWTVTGDSTVHNLTLADDDLSLIASGGHTISYNASSAANAWLNGTTHSLSGGGSLKPM